MPEVEREQCGEMAEGNPDPANKCVLEIGHEGPHSWDKEALAEYLTDPAKSGEPNPLYAEPTDKEDEATNASEADPRRE